MDKFSIQIFFVHLFHWLSFQSIHAAIHWSDESPQRDILLADHLTAEISPAPLANPFISLLPLLS